MNNSTTNQINSSCNTNSTQPYANEVGFLSSCFINSIYQGVSLNEFVGQIEEAKETPKEKQKEDIKQTHHNDHHPTPLQPGLSNLCHSPKNNENTPALSKYKKNAVNCSKKSSGSKSMSMSYCSKDEKNSDSLIKTYKVSSATEKQRRVYEEKVKAMQNRLNALKKQEDDLSRKMTAHHHKERELEQIKAEKDMLKNALRIYKYNQTQQLDVQKQKNNEQKEKVQVNVKESMTKMKIKKNAEFDMARAEKQLVNTMISENAEQLDNINQKKIEDIKSNHESFKAEEARKKKERQERLKSYYLSKMAKDEEETQALKAKISEMEKLEEQYVQSLRTTQKQNEMLFKGSWILKNEEQQGQLKINVNVNANVGKAIVRTHKRVESAKRVDTKKQETEIVELQSKINDKPKIKYNHHQRERSAEIMHNNTNSNTPYSSKNDRTINKTATKTTTTTKNASCSIDKTTKGK